VKEAGAKDGKVIGGVFVVLGAAALLEGRRLYALREQMVAGAVVGDDTFPLVVGLAFLVLGGHFLFLARDRALPVGFGQGAVRRRMLWSGAVLIAYSAAVPYLGYTVSTFLGSLGLFRTMGGYGWSICLLLAAIATGALYLAFRVWLLQPLPAGLLGI
jgi:hypothetical protein